MSSTDEAVRTCDLTVGFLIFNHARARFSCHLPDRIALNIVQAIYQMQGTNVANAPQNGSGGGGEAPPTANPPQHGMAPNAGGEATPSAGGEAPTTPGGETYVRQCLQCGQMFS